MTLLLAGLTVLTVARGPLATSAEPPRAPKAQQQLTLLPPRPDVPASRSRTVSVAKVTERLVPDLMVAVPHLTASQLAELEDIKGVKGVTVMRAGHVTADGKPVAALAVDPATLRAFTPRETASSDELWDAIDRGEIASSYAAQLPLAGSIEVSRATQLSLRVGALASFGIPGADLVVNRSIGEQLGLPSNVIVLAAPDRRTKTLKRDVRAILGADVDITVVRPVAITYRRPATYEELYKLSAQYCPGLSWKVLAAIGQLESGHGRSTKTSSAGARGPMQFLPSTWRSYGVDGDGDGRADILSAYDAVPAAALYLCRNGAGLGGHNLYNAIFNYNHADWYVRKVLALAERY
ncbi:MAG: Lytic transglycosylase catalytic [Frankiales bacterium]|nr:Lytic transglycosylase catalytic [Frankiales bacterium]